MSVYFEKFKGYRIVPANDYSGDYIIQAEEHDDANEMSYHLLRKLNDFLEANHLEGILYTFVPALDEPFEGNFAKYDAERMASCFVLPEKCLEFIAQNDVAGLLEEQKPEDYQDMLEQIHILTSHWQQGYYVYFWH